MKMLLGSLLILISGAIFTADLPLSHEHIFYSWTFGAGIVLLLKDIGAIK